LAFKIRRLKDGGVVFDYEGNISADEVIRANEMVYTSTDHPIATVPYIISDFSKIEKAFFSYEKLKVASAIDQDILEKNPEFLIGVVVTKDLLFGQGRVWQGFLGSGETRTKIFRTREEAEIWVQKKLAEK